MSTIVSKIFVEENGKIWSLVELGVTDRKNLEKGNAPGPVTEFSFDKKTKVVYNYNGTYTVTKGKEEILCRTIAEVEKVL